MTSSAERVVYQTTVMKFCDQYMKGGRKAQYTPKGLLYINEWGPNRYAANVGNDYEIISKSEDLQIAPKYVCFSKILVISKSFHLWTSS